MAGNILGKMNAPTGGVWSLREQYNARYNGTWPLQVGFDVIASYFAGQNFSLYDFRAGANSIYSDTGLTTPITTAGVGIAGVKDLGTNGRNLTQGTSGNRPTSAIGPATFITDDFLNSSASAFNVRSCVIVVQINTGTPNNSGVVTNQSDQGTNIDFVFTLNSATTDWNSTQAAGGGMAASTRFWRNQVQTAAITKDVLCCYSNDATGNGNTLNLPNGARIGWDRANAGRYLNGSIGAVFIHSDTIMSDADRSFVENQFSSIFSLGF